MGSGCRPGTFLRVGGKEENDERAVCIKCMGYCRVESYGDLCYYFFAES